MADRFFRQPIDHFRPSLGTFDQRYYVRDSYVRAGATATPLILFLGGEAPLDGPPAPGSFVDTLARRHGALLVALEHRFYGRSIPFDELTTRNLRLLSLKQILADVGAFCEGYAEGRLHRARPGRAAARRAGLGAAAVAVGRRRRLVRRRARGVVGRAPPVARRRRDRELGRRRAGARGARV